MRIYVLIVHLGIGLVEVSLHSSEDAMWTSFGKGIAIRSNDNSFREYVEDEQVQQMIKAEDWIGVALGWNDFWGGEKYTEFEIHDYDPDSKATPYKVVAET